MKKRHPKSKEWRLENKGVFSKWGAL